MTTFANKVIEFNQNLYLDIRLPSGIRAMNPFSETIALANSSKFYHKFYSDNKLRKFIIGINPGRFGAGVTGVPFTDTKRLASECGIKFSGLHTHEPSSVYVYELINAYGGVAKFYQNFYINSICPLGLVKANDKGKEVNFNYYDDKKVQQLLEPFMLKTIKQQISFGINTSVAFCLGNNQNYKYIAKLNNQYNLFDKLIPLEHPRYIVQYKSKTKDVYLQKHLTYLINE